MQAQLHVETSHNIVTHRIAPSSVSIRLFTDCHGKSTDAPSVGSTHVQCSMLYSTSCHLQPSPGYPMISVDQTTTSHRLHTWSSRSSLLVGWNRHARPNPRDFILRKSRRMHLPAGLLGGCKKLPSVQARLQETCMSTFLAIRHLVPPRCTPSVDHHLYLTGLGTQSSCISHGTFIAPDSRLEQMSPLLHTRYRTDQFR